jgi:hypothetical protein
MSLFLTPDELQDHNLISAELTRAAIDHEDANRNRLYVYEGGLFPFWIDPHNGGRVIQLRTHLNFRESVELSVQLELSNRMNLPRDWASTSVVDGRLHFEFNLPSHPAIARDSLIRTMYRFSESVRRLLRRFDPDTQLLYPLGQPQQAE